MKLTIFKKLATFGLLTVALTSLVGCFESKEEKAAEPVVEQPAAEANDSATDATDGATGTTTAPAEESGH